MNKSEKVPVKTNEVVYTCGGCSMFYFSYEQLLVHLYWRHGTESRRCQRCGLRRWRHAAHLCHMLPAGATDHDTELHPCYCFCGKHDDSPMIGCDSPHCLLEWYHFKCVGIEAPPDGNWFCPNCRKLYAQDIDKSQDGVQT